MSITRENYIGGTATYRQYYGQFVDQKVKDAVVRTIGRRPIRNSTDPHFNDIPLSRWDGMSPLIDRLVGRKIRAVDSGGRSLSDLGCVAKEAARQIKEEEEAT